MHAASKSMTDIVVKGTPWRFDGRVVSRISEAFKKTHTHFPDCDDEDALEDYEAGIEVMKR